MFVISTPQLETPIMILGGCSRVSCRAGFLRAVHRSDIALALDTAAGVNHGPNAISPMAGDGVSAGTTVSSGYATGGYALLSMLAQSSATPDSGEGRSLKRAFGSRPAAMRAFTRSTRRLQQHGEVREQRHFGCEGAACCLSFSCRVRANLRKLATVGRNLGLFVGRLRLGETRHG